MKLSDIKATNQRIEQGAWISPLPNLPGVALKVRGLSNADYSRQLLDLRNEYTPEELKDKAISDRIDAKLLAETVLLDWRGIDDAPYSAETAIQFLSDSDMAVLKKAVIYAAGVVATDGQASLEADAKNSAAPSVGI